MGVNPDERPSPREHTLQLVGVFQQFGALHVNAFDAVVVARILELPLVLAVQFKDHRVAQVIGHSMLEGICLLGSDCHRSRGIDGGLTYQQPLNRLFFLVGYCWGLELGTKTRRSVR